jgi:hypothetical protein
VSLRDQAVAEERALRQALRQAQKIEPYRQPAEAKATLGRLRSMADNVKQLRTKAWHEEARAFGERRAALRERIEEERAKEKERQAREPGRAAIRLLASFADPELRGLSLRAERLTVAQCADLHELVAFGYRTS